MTEPFAARVPRDVVVVSGPDATSFLQNLLSQDLDPVAVGQTVPALLLQPQGKLLVMLRAARTSPDSWSCDCDAGSGAVLAEGLNRFKIRVKVEIEQLALAALAVRGGAPPNEARAIPVAWNGPAFDVVGTAAEVDAVRDHLAFPLVDGPGYERARIEAGVPRLGADLDERTIPQEASLERDAVSFTKGCFVGQELVCRIDTRGHVNRTLRRLRSARGDLRVGAPLLVADKVVGEVTSSVGDVALGMVRREVETGDELTADDTTAVVEAITFG